MRPSEFISGVEEDPDLWENRKRLGKALLTDIFITDGCFKYEVLSYYYSPEEKRMCLDIQKVTA